MRETLDLLEIRLAAADEDGTVEGIAVKFDTLDTYGTTFDRAAFAGVAKRIPMLWSHDPSQVVGSWTSIVVANDGLRVKGKLNLAVQRAQEVRAMLTAGDIGGISIGFETIKAEAKAGGTRHITKVKLHEISLVAMASVPGARVTAIRTRHGAGVADFIQAVKSAASAFST
jgi:HK97 family phage prohead protease